MIETFYTLDPEHLEKETSVYEQQVDVDNPSYAIRPLQNNAPPALSDQAISNAKFFVPYVDGSRKPGRPAGSGREGFHFSSSQTLAFRGVGGKDMAYMWHMLVVPANCLNTHGHVTIKWVFDLKPKHIPLLIEMKSNALKWFSLNKTWFQRRFAAPEYNTKLGGRSVRDWLKPENIQFGFHHTPTVGVLHLHALAGPLTEFGGEEGNRSRWIPLGVVMDVIATGQPFTVKSLEMWHRKKADLAKSKRPRSANKKNRLAKCGSSSSLKRVSPKVAVIARPSTSPKMHRKSKSTVTK